MPNPGTQVLSDISTALSQLFAPELARQFNRHSVIAELIPKKTGTGKNVAWDTRFSRTTHAAAFTEGSDIAAGEFNTDPTQPASLSWGMYRVAFSLSGLSVAAAATSPGSALELLDQFQTNLEDAAMDLVSQINAAVYAGTGASGQIAGFIGGGALAATGTYAGVNRTTYPEWAGNVLGNSGTPRPLTKPLLDQLEGNIYTACGMPPDVIVCSPSIAQEYEQLFDTVKRVMIERGELSAMANGNTVSGEPMIARNSGYTGLTYKGIPIYRDRNCPGAQLFMLNSQYTEIKVLPQVELGAVSLAENKAMSGAPGNPTGISAKVESLAKTGDADKFQLKVYLQLVCRRPNASGYLDDLE
jgi:hypothetical protein